MKKKLSILLRVIPLFLIGFLLQAWGCNSPESDNETTENSPAIHTKKEKNVPVRVKKPLQRIKENELIKVDKDKVPIRISEGIKTPEAMLESINNKTFSGNMISVNFKDLDIRVAIKRFTALLGYPIKIDPAIVGKVTYKLKNTPWNQVLADFLQQNRLEILFDGFQLYVRKKRNDTPGISLALFFFLIPLVLLLAWLVKNFFHPSRANKSSPSLNIKPEKIEEYIKRIVFLLDVEKIYKEDDFSLKKLAGLLSLQPYVVSRIINERLKQSFPGLLNQYRIDEAQRLLSIKDSKLNILDIAFEVGFKSKTAFNRIFKKLAGMTPSQFRAKSQS